MSKPVIASIALVIFGFLSARAQAPAAAESAEGTIRAVLQQQVDAWNKHDLEGFMAGYWNSPELTFFSGGTETKGWQPTLEQYRKAYQANGAEMGKLDFSDLRVIVLGVDSAFVRGRWHLTMPDGKEPHGLYTLVLRKFPEGWRIIHDHTSAAQ
jgi:beta-aspartyl-peptidase (threonine type)